MKYIKKYNESTNNWQKGNLVNSYTFNTEKQTEINLPPPDFAFKSLSLPTEVDSNNYYINESFQCDDIEIEKFLIKIKDDFANLSDKFNIFYNWEAFPSLEDYINLYKDEKFTKNKLSFYITIFKDNNIQKDLENWNGRNRPMKNPSELLDKKMNLLDYEMDFFKRIKHLIKTTDFYLWYDEFDRDGGVTLVADFIRN